MSIVSKQIWVVGHDYGLEGKGEPEMVFLDERTARAGLALINKSGGAPRYLSAVPVWQYSPAPARLAAEKEKA